MISDSSPFIDVAGVIDLTLNDFQAGFLLDYYPFSRSFHDFI